MRDVQLIAAEEERWIVISAWPDYAVSDHGRVKRLTSRTCAKAGHILRAVPRSKRKSGGYLSVDLCRDGRKRTEMVHILVARAFLGDPPADAPEINHKDGRLTNCASTNLEYVTSSGNQLHAYEIGLQDARGELNGQAKLTESNVRDIRAAHTGLRGEQTRLAETYGVNPSTIRDVLNRRTWTLI